MKCYTCQQQKEKGDLMDLTSSELDENVSVFICEDCQPKWELLYKNKYRELNLEIPAFSPHDALEKAEKAHDLTDFGKPTIVSVRELRAVFEQDETRWN